MDRLTDDILKLRSCYRKGYEFPIWKSKMYEKYMKSVKIYYSSKDNPSTTLKNVIELSEKREPTNISTRRLYDEDRLKEYFGYEKGIYGEFNYSINMSLFAKTLFYVGNNEYININVLSVIAPAFDNYNQPDFKFFKNDEEIIRRFELIFDMIFNCAIENELGEIFLNGIGIGAFKNKFTNYRAGFEASYAKWEKRLKNIQLFYISYNADEAKKLFPANILSDVYYVDYNKLREFIKHFSDKGIDKILFINPWDPFSIIGNGNFNDNSWDGAIGRDSALAILGYPLLNPHIQYIDLEF